MRVMKVAIIADKQSHNPLMCSVFLAMYFHFPQKSPVQESILLFEWITIGFINVVDVMLLICLFLQSNFLYIELAIGMYFQSMQRFFTTWSTEVNPSHSNCSPNPGSMNNTILIKSFLLYNSRHACSFPCYSCCSKTRLTTVTTLPWIKEFHILGLKLLLIGLLDI